MEHDDQCIQVSDFRFLSTFGFRPSDFITVSRNCPAAVQKKDNRGRCLIVFSPESLASGEEFDLGMNFAAVFFDNATVNMKQQKPDGAKRVLVVDDDQDFRRYISDCLEAEGIVCFGATSVSEALEALERNNISVLLVDWFLDHLATDLVRKARSMSPHIPIIVMSGKSYNVKMDALLADADEFLEKLIGGSAVAQRVKRWMSRLQAAPDAFLPQREQDILLLDEVKYRYIQHVVELVGNNISLAAQKLGVHRQTVSAAMATEDSDNANNGSESAKVFITRGGTNDRE